MLHQLELQRDPAGESECTRLELEHRCPSHVGADPLTRGTDVVGTNLDGFHVLSFTPLAPYRVESG